MTPFLAAAIVVLHLAFILFAALGGLLALRWRWIPWVHLPAVAWAAIVELTDRVCPLTPLEITLRHAAGQPGYAGDFVEHYLAPIVYPPGLTRGVQLALATGLVVLNAAIYVIVWRRRR